MKKMGKIKLFPAGLILLLAFSAHGGDKEGKKKAQDKKPAAEITGSSSAAEVLDKLQSFYDATKDFQADFEQVYKHKIYDEEKKSSGKVFIQRPGKMRWEYKKPDKKLFVADGTTIWIYEEGINQVTKQALGESDLPVAITFLVGKGKLKDEFTCKIVPHEKFSSKGKLVLELTPKKPSPQYKKLLFIVGKADVQVERTIIIDEAGNTNTMRFKNVQINKGIDPKKFQFKPPKGATIVEP
jgi:outer membrane lipoprotein carrier protein